MKSRITIGYFALFMVVSTSCSNDQQTLTSDSVSYASILNVASDGLSTVITPSMQAALVETPDLLTAEVAVLAKMKEEEKLARDVYSALSVKWSNQVFYRIATAENNHMDAIVNLLDYYETSDTLVAEAGIFQNVEIQNLYNDLIVKGNVSVEEALKVGALIEEMDIKDIQNGLLATTNENITLVFENLERGSRNHLRSFSRQLTALGIVYSPIYISQSEYDTIINSSFEKGKGYAINGKGKGLGRHGGGTCDSSNVTGVTGQGLGTGHGGGRRGHGGH